MADAKSSPNTSLTGALSQLENTLEEYLVKKAPFTLPTGVKDFIVMIAPWFTLVGLILAIPAILMVFGLGAIVAPMAFLGGVKAGTTFTVSIAISIVALVLNALALPGLFKRTKSGWNFVFYSSLVGVISNIVTFSIGGLIIGSLLGLYVLFQVKEYYK